MKHTSTCTHPRPSPALHFLNTPERIDHDAAHPDSLHTFATLEVGDAKQSQPAPPRQNAGYTQPNPDTHCPECHEPLSEYGHCWQHHWPPMDPAQDMKPTPSLPFTGYAPSPACRPTSEPPAST